MNNTHKKESIASCIIPFRHQHTLEMGMECRLKISQKKVVRYLFNWTDQFNKTLSFFWEKEI